MKLSLRAQVRQVIMEAIMDSTPRTPIEMLDALGRDADRIIAKVQQSEDPWKGGPHGQLKRAGRIIMEACEAWYRNGGKSRPGWLGTFHYAERILALNVSPKPVTEEVFLLAVGCKPEKDDLERVNCPLAGTVGHFQCGWCHSCGKPKFHCCCLR